MWRGLGTALLALAFTAPAHAATVASDRWFTASDGVELQTTVSGKAPLGARPTIVEFSPYGDNSGTLNAGDDYNHVLVQIRGTGDSHGSFDALGPRTQKDVQEVLDWACHQPFSDGRLALNGFSASAITIYNSLHLKLPCVRAATLKSGTFELYRDLLTPGGISNLVPGAGVLALIGAPALAQGGDRDPATILDAFSGMFAAGTSVLQHQTLDGWWRERGFRGDVNHLPVLVINGFFDVESRGAFQGYQRLRRDGAHIVVIGAHDGAPADTDAGYGEMVAWMDRHVRGVANGVDQHPRAQLWLSDGDRELTLQNQYVRYDAADWPVPKTRWRTLWLDGKRLVRRKPKTSAEQAYPAAPSFPINTDPPNAGIVGGFGFNALSQGFAPLGDMTLAEPLGLSYTTAPLTKDLLSAGPAALSVTLASTSPETPIWVVLSDVWPDGTAHPLTAGRLLSSFARINRKRSLIRGGRVVQPLNRLGKKEPDSNARRYHVELWPVGNRFRKGHSIRLHIVGASAASPVAIPGVNTVTTGGSKLLLPVLP
jgi:predicted acyl esterase